MVETAAIFDRKLLAMRRQRAARNFQEHDFLFTWAAQNLQDRLADINRNFETSIQIGTRGPQFLDALRTETSSNQENSIITDEEFFPFKNASLDLVITNLGLHSTNDLPGTLIQIRRALKPDGLFIASMFGGETLHELRTSLMETEIATKGGASPRIFPFADKQQMGALMQRAGFALPVIDSERITVTYPNMFKLMHDLRGMGENNIINARDKTYPGRELFAKAAQHYAQNFAEEDGRIFATFEIIFLIGWAPHDSQQQPLKPGSAETRLADALGTEETKTGDKATP